MEIPRPHPLYHGVLVKARSLVGNRYSSWFNRDGPRKTVWEPWPKPSCLLHPLLSVQSRELHLDALKEKGGPGFREGEALEVPSFAQEPHPSTVISPIAVRNPPQKAFLPQKHLATQQTFTEGGNAPCNSSTTQRPWNPKLILIMPLPHPHT